MPKTASKVTRKSATITGAHGKGAITLDAKDYAAFLRKVQGFRTTLTSAERKVLDFLLQSSTDQQQRLADM